MTRVFISHSSEERELATYLSDWMEKSLPETRCFCSSRPTNLPPGREWLRDICHNAKNSDLCLMLLSPYSASNSWLHFEVGLVLGAADISENRVVPVLYGGISHNNVPQTVLHIQYLSLEDSANFNAFISEYFLMKKEPSSAQMHEAFKEGLSSKAARLLKYGEFGSWISDKVLTEKLTHPISLKGGQDIQDDFRTEKRFNNFGELISIRAKIIPRRASFIQHWKFGLTLLRQADKDNPVRVFQFHSGCHAGLNTWTVYFSPEDNYSVNESARLETERSSILELWLSSDKSSVACIGIDSDSRYKVLMNDRWENLWRLKDNSWTEVSIAAWADGAPFQVDLVELEIDRIPYWDTKTLSWMGGAESGKAFVVALDRLGD